MGLNVIHHFSWSLGPLPSVRVGGRWNGRDLMRLGNVSPRIDECTAWSQVLQYKMKVSSSSPLTTDACDSQVCFLERSTKANRLGPSTRLTLSLRTQFRDHLIPSVPSESRALLSDLAPQSHTDACICDHSLAETH